MGERFSGVAALFYADNIHYPGLAPREEWIVLSKDWIIWTGQEVAEAAARQPDPFTRSLGVILGAMAQRYTDMAEDDVDLHDVIVFGSAIREQTGVTSCSPLEYALAILTNSVLGECIVESYKQMASEHNDPSGQKLLDHLLAIHVGSYQ